MLSANRVRFARFVLLVSVLMESNAAPQLYALPRTWIGGNVNWNETAGADANWNPNTEPDVADEAIFNTANSVNLGTNNSIQAMTMSGGIDLLTNDFDLTVDGLVQLNGASTTLIIGGAAGSINADNVTINSGGNVGNAISVGDTTCAPWSPEPVYDEPVYEEPVYEEVVALPSTGVGGVDASAIFALVSAAGAAAASFGLRRR